MKKPILLIALGVGVGALASTYLVSYSTSLQKAFAAPPARIDVSRPSVVTEVRSLGQLVSYSMELEKIIESGTWGGNAFQRAWYKDHMLFIANGTVVAGFDLAALSEQSVVETDSMIKVDLGSPKLLFSKIDNSRSRVFERDVGSFNFSPDDHLESRTRAKAEETLRQAACQSGILQKAGTSGQAVVRNLLERVLRAAKVDKTVVVTFSVGAC
jgi:hypothetical protein